MKKIYYLSAIILFSGELFAQSEAVSPTYSFRISKEIIPPIIEVVEEPIFIDEDGNRAIDAQESCKIVMKIKNSGRGDGVGLSARISATGTTSGLSFQTKSLPTLKAGSTATVEFPINADMATKDGYATFEFYVNEPLGFNSDKYTMEVRTRKFQEPLVVVNDYKVVNENGGTLEKTKQFSLQIVLQNVQQGIAEDVKVNLKIPDNVFNVTGEDYFTFAKMEAGESQILKFDLIVNNIYEGTNIPILVNITEKYRKYAESKTINLELHQPVSADRTIAVVSNIQQANIQSVQLRSDVDVNIPVTGKSNPSRYAIIIGNQDYHSSQRDLNSEQDVPFAIEDANMFREYCESVLGVQGNNISLLSNATSAKMQQEIDFITRLAQRDPNAEIIFYYAGHGFPDENTKEPYLIPVDVNASNLGNAISLYELYDKLSKTNAKRVTVFLDACFSGGGRDAGLVASRGIRITPKKSTLTGNLVVFSATTADQTALPYNAKYHGMFTYFLLKKLKETSGECSYSELYDFLNKKIGEYSLRENRKVQTPEVNTSLQVQDSWREWRFQ
ncbi:MAG: caspase family protein [Bacteroidales bacterium]|nr:caspase family protein [Bacteroidales bacterium]